MSLILLLPECSQCLPCTFKALLVSLILVPATAIAQNRVIVHFSKDINVLTATSVGLLAALREGDATLIENGLKRTAGGMRTSTDIDLGAEMTVAVPLHTVPGPPLSMANRNLGLDCRKSAQIHN